MHRHLLLLPRFKQINSLLCCLQLEKYQEQSQLLDPCLEGIIVPLSQLLRKQAVASAADLELTNALCRMLMVAANVRCSHATNLLQLPLCHAHRQWGSACTAKLSPCLGRGSKVVVKFFPHDAADLEPVANFMLHLHHKVPCICRVARYVPCRLPRMHVS